MGGLLAARALADRKSTRLNSSHSQISYAVFCLKKKKHNHFVYLDQRNMLLACRKRLGPTLPSPFRNFHQQAVFAIPAHKSIFFSQIKHCHRNPPSLEIEYSNHEYQMYLVYQAIYCASVETRFIASAG